MAPSSTIFDVDVPDGESLAFQGPSRRFSIFYIVSLTLSVHIKQISVHERSVQMFLVEECPRPHLQTCGQTQMCMPLVRALGTVYQARPIREGFLVLITVGTTIKATRRYFADTRGTVDTGYFDVDTMTVLTRCLKTLVPREDYVAEVLAGVPDLYGGWLSGLWLNLYLCQISFRSILGPNNLDLLAIPHLLPHVVNQSLPRRAVVHLRLHTSGSCRNPCVSFH